MDPRLLAALLSSVVSQTLLFLLQPSSPSSNTPLPLFFFSSSSNSSSLSLLLLQLFSTTTTTTASSILVPPRKKKRPSYPSSDANPPQAGLDNFVLFYKMRSETFEWLSGLLDPLLSCCRDPPGPPLHLSGPTRLALALSRLATGSPSVELAQRFGVSVSAVDFCTRRLCRVLCTNFRFWLAFPSPPSTFRGLPGCCGAMSSVEFGGRRAQVVTDESSRIISFAIGFNTGSSDFRVLKASSLYEDMENRKLLGSSQYLVGLGNYPLLHWLMVPFKDPVIGSKEEDFNLVHHEMCLPVIKAIESLRSWGIMNHLDEEDEKAAVSCIATCAILHNVMLIREDYSALVDVGEEEMEAYENRCRETKEVGDFTEQSVGSILRSMLTLPAKEIRSSGVFSAARR